jgi:rod shape-determining protein MreB
VNRTKTKKAAKCPACGRGEFRAFYLGNSAATSVLGTELFEQLPTKTVTAKPEEQTGASAGRFRFSKPKATYTVTEKMLKYFIGKIGGRFLFAPRIMICIPSQITEVEKKAVIDAASNAGARKVYLIEEPIAAAIGAGIDISKPCGNMIVDIGGGTTDIAVISLGGSVVSSSIKVAGDKFDEYIVKYIKKRHNVMIGERTAEELKQQIGCVFPKIQDMEMDVRGRDLITGLPKTITIYSSEMMEALEEPAMLIVDAVHSVLEKTPPELAADISDKGIYMTGGGCLIDGLDRLLQEKTGINVMIAEDAISCVAKGTGKALDNLDIMDKMRR